MAASFKALPAEGKNCLLSFSALGSPKRTLPLKQPQGTHSEENRAKGPQTLCQIESNVRLEKQANLRVFDYTIGNKYFPFRCPIL